MSYAGILEINEPTEKRKVIYPELAIARESATITCVLAEPQRWARFRVERKKLCVCPDGKLLAWGGWRQLNRRLGGSLSYVVGEGCIFDFFRLILNWKQGQKLGKPSVTN